MMIFIIIIITSLILIFKNRNKFIGTWITEGNTIYVFKTKTGIMKTQMGDYSFKYRIKDNTITIDFIDDKAIDTTYKYTLKDDKIIMESERTKFTFTKK